MALVQVPRIKLERVPEHIIKNLQIALERFRADFDNAAANAINPSDVNSPTDGPSTGSGGAGALTIDQPPTNITLTTGSELNETNHTREAFVDVAFTKPPNAVGVEIFYRQNGETNFRQTYTTVSPYRLLHLLPGIEYNIQLAGEAANGSLGPTSHIQNITTPGSPTGENSEVATTTTHYVVTEQSNNLTNEHILRGEQDVITIETPEGVARVEITPLGITTPKLNDLSVTTPKLNDLSVTTQKIADLAITTPKINDLSVTEGKLDNNSVTNLKLADMLAVSVKVRNVLSLGDPVDLQATVNDTVLARLTTTLEWSKVTNAMLAVNSVDNPQLTDNSVSESKLSARAVTTAKIADNNITTNKIADAQVTGPKLATGSVGSTHLTPNSVDTTNLIDQSVTSAKIAEGTIQTNDLGNLSVTGGKIADNTITQAKLQSGSVGSTQIQSNSVGDLELRDSVGTSVIGRSIGTTGNPADIVATTAGQVLWRPTNTVAFAPLPLTALGVSTWSTAVLTITGIVSPTTVTVTYLLAGQMVWLYIPSMTGVSNSTTLTLTGLPAAILPGNSFTQSAWIRNNSANSNGSINFTAASNVITFFDAIAWAGTGNKGVFASWWFYTTGFTL